MSDSLITTMSTMREQEALAIAEALLDGGEDPLKVLDAGSFRLSTSYMTFKF